jgi:hypothetical protein
MKKKLLFSLIGGLVVLLVGFQGAAFAAGIVLKINDNGILLNSSNASFAPTYTGPGSVDTSNIEFFAGSPPASPTSTSGRLGNFNYTALSGGVNQYDNLSTSARIYLRSWEGAPRTQGNHYGISAGYQAASGSSPALQYPVVSFKTDYLADAPTNAPTITSVSESSDRVGDTTEVILSLTVGYSYSQGTSPNKIVATGYDVKYWIDPESVPSDTDPNRVVSDGGSPWALPASDPKNNLPFSSGTYHFQVRAKNEFGPGPWSTVKDWPTLAGGAGGASASITYFLRKASDDTVGLNAVSVLHNVPFKVNGTSVTTIADLTSAVNTVAGADVVTAVGKLVNGEMVGVYVTYDSGNAIYTPTAGLADAENTQLVRGESWQISVSGDVDVTFSQ